MCVPIATLDQVLKARGAMHSALWIVGVNHVSLQSLDVVPLQQSDQIVRRQAGITLSEWPPWFANTVSEDDVPQVAGSGFKIYGVARLTARGALLQSGSLFNPGREDKLLMDMLLQPADAALFKIVDAVSLREPIEITRRKTASFRQRSIVTLVLCLFERVSS